MDLDVERDVLPKLKDPTNARRLLYHPHNELLTSDSQGFHFLNLDTEKTQRPRGLTTPLAEVFWPEDAMPRMRIMKGHVWKPTRYAKTRPRKAWKSKRRPGPRGNTVHTASRGMLRGNIVHGQIEDLINMDAKHFNRKHRIAHAWSYGMVKALCDRGFRPLAAELGVIALCEDVRDSMNMATRLDLAAVNNRGHVIFIETKTGYESKEEWDGATGWMHSCLHGVLRDSAKNRAVVQVLMGALMAVKSRGLTGVFECWVVHITSAGTEFLKVDPAFIRTYGELIYQTMRQHLNKDSGR